MWLSHSMLQVILQHQLHCPSLRPQRGRWEMLHIVKVRKLRRCRLISPDSRKTQRPAPTIRRIPTELIYGQTPGPRMATLTLSSVMDGDCAVNSIAAEQ